MTEIQFTKEMDRDDVGIMLVIHSLQTEAWSDLALENKDCKQEFKFRAKALNVAAKQLNKFMEITNEDYEISAEVSDSLLKMAKLPVDKLHELSEIINDYVQKNT